MNHAAESRRTPDRPVGDLVSELSQQLSDLARDELRLARLEMTRKGKEAGTGIGMLGGAGLTALYGAGCLIACVVIAISGALAAWAAALIVGATLLAVAGVVALLGKGRLQRAAPPLPANTTANLKADVEIVKDRARQ